ncbi:hypothetical protein BI036_gp108 [Morganella phage vB_MmoM_MP1]|uniref:Uncharacterized protein n=1 Tax=Morganella phage vB_MmoM_MP1 TaxID=1852628 RepID=A0A192YC99_9CAUD|nr:hypothetical protein BI036_gp108 [Morganella phage vB_MmoM_MP1]ANM46491.1 hypothetical protein MP1_gp0107 [Morganella phage vB_MmoM_MP1]
MKGIEKFDVRTRFSNPNCKSIFIGTSKFYTDTIEAVYNLLIDNTVSDLVIKEKTEYNDRPIISEYRKKDYIKYLEIKFNHADSNYSIDIMIDRISDVLYRVFDHSKEEIDRECKAEEIREKLLTEYWPKFFRLANDYDNEVKALREMKRLKVVSDFVDECRRRHNEN